MSLPWGDLGILKAARNQQAAEAMGPGAGGVSQGVRHGCWVLLPMLQCGSLSSMSLPPPHTHTFVL